MCAEYTTWFKVFPSSRQRGKSVLSNILHERHLEHHQALQKKYPLTVIYHNLVTTRETFKGENFRELVKKRFLWKNICGLLPLPRQWMPCPQIMWRKLSRIATKPRNSRTFFPLQVSRYTVVMYMVSHNL